MRRAKWLAWFFPLIIVIIAVVIAYFLDTGDGTPFSVSSTGETGTSLLFDTMRHMGYPARRSYRRLTPHTDTNNVYVIIHPSAPYINEPLAKFMLEWVYAGGRLVYLCGCYPHTAFDTLLYPNGTSVGAFTLYTHGDGAVLTGDSMRVQNIFMMDNHTHGQLIQATISQWNAEREFQNIFFAEYYHGFHTPENFIARMPLFMRLILAQLVILSIVGLWFFGKRFGNSVPYYEEVEREENEYVRALARLYSHIRRKK